MSKPQSLARIYTAAHPNVRFWRDDWWNWQTTHYTPVKAGVFQVKLAQFLAGHLAETGSTAGVPVSLVNNVTLHIKGLTLIPDEVEQQTFLPARDGRFVSMANGILNMRTMELEPHTPTFWSSYYLPYAFDPDAKCPLWLSFLDQILEGDEERVKLLQEWFGYCLIPDTFQQKFLLLEGEGGNGKGVLCDHLAAIIGQENRSQLSLNRIDKQFSPIALVGKLVNVSNEAEHLGHQSESALKEWTGGDRITIDRKFQAPLIGYKPSVRFVISTNQRPDFKDTSNGLWRRMLLVRLPVSIPYEAQDRFLGHKLEGELAGTLNWALAGLQRLREAGRFTRSTQSEDAVADYKLAANPIGQFLRDFYVEAATDQEEDSAAVYDSYAKWARANGYPVQNSTTVGVQVKKVFPSVQKFRYKLQARTVYQGLQELPSLAEARTGWTP